MSGHGRKNADCLIYRGEVFPETKQSELSGLGKRPGEMGSRGSPVLWGSSKMAAVWVLTASYPGVSNLMPSACVRFLSKLGQWHAVESLGEVVVAQPHAMNEQGAPPREGGGLHEFAVMSLPSRKSQN